MASATNKALALTPHEFAHLGDGALAYVKTINSEDVARLFPQAPPLRPGVKLFALLGADGTPILLTDFEGRRARQRHGERAADRQPALIGEKTRAAVVRRDGNQVERAVRRFEGSSLMRPYLDLMRDALENGAVKSDRTGTGVRSLFGRQIRFDLSHGFPLVTTKRLHLKSIVRELVWFLKGDTNIAYLKAHGVSIWDEWADADGDLGPVYGRQWRAWQGPDGRTYDQIDWLIKEIRRNPDSRRLVVSAWNVADIERMKLPPCHCLFQFNVTNGKLSCQLYQRSADIFLGVPFNIASYALLTHLIARECGLGVGEFVHTFGDAHLYRNHEDQAREQLSREPRPLPQLVLGDVGSIFDLNADAIVFEGYDPWPAIKAKIAV